MSMPEADISALLDYTKTVLGRYRWRLILGRDPAGLRLAYNLDRIAFGNEHYWPALGTCYHPASEGRPAVLYGKYVCACENMPGMLPHIHQAGRCPTGMCTNELCPEHGV